MTKSKLMNCPFCGESDELLYESFFSTYIRCPCGLDFEGADSEETIKRWNTRAAQPVKELSDANIEAIGSSYNCSSYSDYKDFARAVIAADRALQNEST